MALHSALSLGINLRLTDDRTKDAAKETRGRLWWSIYSLEHLITSMTGRPSCVGESLCSVPAPLPYEEETFNQPDAKRLLQDSRPPRSPTPLHHLRSPQPTPLPRMGNHLSTLSIPLLLLPRRPNPNNPRLHEQGTQHRRPS
jgi:Fungal specific transcription factor domain.